MEFALRRKKKRLEMISRYTSLFKTEDGEKVLWDLCKTFNVVGTTFDTNPHVMAYNEGARAVVMRILQTINTDPEALDKLMSKGQSEDDYEI